MTSQELSLKLQQSLGLPQETVDSLMTAMTESISHFIKELDEVAIPGFGTFAPVKYDERVCCNSESGEKSLLPPSIEVDFRPSVVVRKRFIG